MGFTPALGVDQRDVTSPLIRRALKPHTDADKRYWAHVSGLLGNTTGLDQCFVDDLLCMSSNVEGMQKKADAVSTFPIEDASDVH